MKTIEEFTNKGINVVSEKEGLHTIVNGKVNPVTKMMIGILETLAEFELNRLKERQFEGIEKAKIKGKYLGRKKGTKESEDIFRNKLTTQKIMKCLQEGESIRRAALLSKCSTGKVQKVKRMMENES